MFKGGKEFIFAFLLIFIFYIIFLLAKNKLTLGLALIWIGMLVSGGLVLLSDRMLHLLMVITRAKDPLSALIFLCFVYTGLILLYFAQKITTLTQSHEQLVQSLALTENYQRKNTPPSHNEQELNT